uniref:Fungal lipase-type domain-containing protein n=1 Tax=Araucaria cunninghamii TaxID=56994 RepID=A0A0D6R374_ARACU
MGLAWCSRNFKFSLLLVLCVVALCEGRELRRWTLDHKHHGHVYNRTLAKILAQYASAVYMTDLDALISWTCSRCNGLTKRFQMVELIVDVENCLQAFVGIAEDIGATVIAFRGTQENSFRNWVENLFFKQVDLDYPGMSGSMVHHGFYSAYHNTSLRPGVVEAVKRIQKRDVPLPIMVTGHSMGGAMASFCALDLTVNYGAKDVQVVTFGQPRIGNKFFADYYNMFVPKTIRVTHNHDIVPHLPPYYTHFLKRTYHHFPQEIWIHSVGFGSLVFDVERICDGSGEDPSCSRSVSGNSLTDHLEYYGVSMQAETWGKCGWVLKADQNGSYDAKVVIDIDSQKSSLALNAFQKTNASRSAFL